MRIYHDQALYKESGGGFTPWHADQYYWPLSNENAVTAWIPLQPVELDMGPLSFAERSHKDDLGRGFNITDESEQVIQSNVQKGNYPVDSGAFELGEVSFHYGWTFHRADANHSQIERKVMTIIYIDEAMRLADPKNRNQHQDRENWLPGVEVGNLCNSPLNPIIWSSHEAVS